MNRDIINRILDEFEDARNAFASGAIQQNEYENTCRTLNGRLNVFGIGLTVVMATPPF